MNTSSLKLTHGFAPIAATLRRPTLRKHHLPAFTVTCNAIPADGQTPRTSEPAVAAAADLLAATPKLAAVLERITAAKARQAAQGTTKLDR